MEQAQYDQILILGKKYMSEKSRKKDLKRKKKGRKDIYQNIYSGGLWVLGIQVILFCLYVLFLAVCFLVSKYSFIKREKNQSL